MYKLCSMFTKQLKGIIMDSAFNELGYNEISEFMNIHFFKSELLNKDNTMKGDNFFFLGPLNFAE